MQPLRTPEDYADWWVKGGAFQLIFMSDEVNKAFDAVLVELDVRWNFGDFFERPRPGITLDQWRQIYAAHTLLTK